MAAKITVYNYDIDGYYSGTGVAVESPLERGSGNYLIPGNATTTPPLEPRNGMNIRWVNDEWVYEPATIITDKQIRESGLKARALRDELLYRSDWTQLPDVPDWVDVQAWRDYRQKLRDVPQQLGFPVAITWPDAPAKI